MGDKRRRHSSYKKEHGRDMKREKKGRQRERRKGKKRRYREVEKFHENS